LTVPAGDWGVGRPGPVSRGPVAVRYTVRRMAKAPEEVRAAGGLVVRDGLVAVVHRPRYDDWSLPKGKLDPGESWEEAAVREVQEETGIRARIVGELDPVHYTDRKGRRKTVRWYRMDAEATDPFEPDHEVDELRWLAPQEALTLVSYDHDRSLLETLV
jgi:8-oxo-dGTP diphosphatase